MDIDILKKTYTKTTIFLMPILYEGYSYDQILTEDFINCYITQDKEANNYKLILVTKTEAPYGAFFIPKEFSKDVVNFLQGNYSKLSEKLKQLILNFWNEKEDSSIYSILYLTDTVIEKYWVKRFGEKCRKWHNYAERWPEPVLTFEMYDPCINFNLNL